MLLRDAAARETARLARTAVVEYYNHCWDDYRILWRTDKNASVHLGFFDRSATSADARFRSIASALVGIAAAPVAAVAAVLLGRQAAVRCLKVAARGRAARHDAAQHRMTAACAQAVDLQPGEGVLDAGCGVGGTDLWLAETYRVRVHGVNIQPLHLREARRNASAHPAGSRVRFSMQDFTELAIANESIDVVWGLESVCHCADKRAFVGEAFRVLRPGGRLMVADFFLTREDIPPRHAEAMRTWTSGWALPNLASLEGFRSMLEGRGFRDVVCRDVGAHVLPSSRRLYRASVVARPIHALLEPIGARSAIAGANVRAAFCQYAPLRDGVWTYGVCSAKK